MQCDEVRSELEAYCRDELTSDVRSRIETHLSACAGCAEEAVTMQNLLSTIKKGLQDWVDQGICPPALSARIEASIRAERRTQWWRPWRVYASTVTAAAAVFVLLMVVRPEFAEQLAAVPLLGALAAPLTDPDIEWTSTPSVEQLRPTFRADRVVSVAASTEQHGIQVTVNKVEAGGGVLRLHYTIEGITLDKKASLQEHLPSLAGPGGQVRLRSLSATQRRDHVAFRADFDLVPPGQNLALTVPRIPAVVQGTRTMVSGPWQISFTN